MAEAVIERDAVLDAAALAAVVARREDPVAAEKDARVEVSARAAVDAESADNCVVTTDAVLVSIAAFMPPLRSNTSTAAETPGEA